MPLCPQITNTPITVSLTADFTVTNVLPVLAANTEQLATTNATAAAAAAAAASAQSTATTALANAATAYTAAIGSLQPSANTIVNATNQMTAIAANGITVFSGASSTSGARVVLNSTGLAGFNSGGTATFSISASTGAAVFSGSITGSAITGSTLNISGNCIIDASGFLTATGATITGAITATSGSFTGSIFSTSGTIGGFTLSSTSIFSGTNLVIESTGNISGGNSQTLFYGFANIGGGSATGERLIVAGTSALNGNTGVLGNLSVTNSCTFGAVTQQFEFLSSSGNVRVAQTYNNDMGGTTRAMRVSTTGLYGYVSSTRRRKEQIEDYAIDSQALLSLSLKKFKYKNDESGVQQYGFIAEDAQDLGLDELIQYDSTGIPDYFAYETLPIFLLQLIQELKAEIDQLKGE